MSLPGRPEAIHVADMIRGGFLDASVREDLIALVRDGKAETRLTENDVLGIVAVAKKYGALGPDNGRGATAVRLCTTDRLRLFGSSIAFPQSVPLRESKARSRRPSQRGMTVGEAFRAIGHDCLRQLVANEPALRRRDFEAVHQMRVALSRLRAGISLFKEVVHDTRVDRIKSELKWLTGEFGPARELDVFFTSAAIAQSGWRRPLHRTQTARLPGPRGRGQCG